MNIRWFSPLDPGATEVARYSAQLLPILQQYIGVSSVGEATGEHQAAWWSGPGQAGLAQQGMEPVPVYHIGNNPLHLPIHELACAEPGLVVLHDLSLVDLARHLSHESGEPGQWKEQMVAQYGEEVRGLVNRSEKSSADYNEMTSRYPLFQPFVENALGVVVHSQYAREALLRYLPEGIPVRQLNLPYSGGTDSLPRDYGARPLRFVFCGHVGPNRRLLEFFDAWSQLEDPAGICLELYGNIRNRTQLLQYADHFGIAEYLDIRGYVDDETLEKALHSAHFAINLRWPTMGEASASQLRYWSAALPTLVTDVGWYGELPDDCVCKISVDNEVDELAATLRDALDFPAKYQETGERGRAYMHSQHRADSYAQALASFARQLGERRLGYKVLDQELVTIIASMCEDGTNTGLFRDAIETAVATFEPGPLED